MAKKPKQILNFEKQLNIKLRESDAYQIGAGKGSFWEGGPCYALMIAESFLFG